MLCAGHVGTTFHPDQRHEQRQAYGINGSGVSPIDHIFQFHKALRQELKQLEADAAALEAAALSDWSPSREPHTQQQQQQSIEQQGQQHGEQQQLEEKSPVHCLHQAADADASGFLRRCAAALQQLDGRFQFLRGIYRAHSKAEDEIVFPALEAKEALHNVSHAYTLDHEQEEQLFHDLAGVISRVQSSSSMQEVRSLSLQLRRMCAAVRASLETHVRAEEAELWPLFSEHFTMEEQQHLVGVIIGRTGAEVLQALLPWVTGSFSDEEKEAMMDSLREATKNTMFDQWLDAIQSGASGLQAAAAGRGAAGSSGGDGGSGAGGSSSGGAGRAGEGGGGDASGLQGSLAEIAEYLAGEVAVPAGGSSSGGGLAGELGGNKSSNMQETSGTVAESASYRPGWEEIFNINQKQLEAAIRRVSNDPKLEPQRKAYLIQNIMVSRYIVAQQRRLGMGTEPQQQQGHRQQQQLGHASTCQHASHSHEGPLAGQHDSAVVKAGAAAVGVSQQQQQQLVGATAAPSGQAAVAAAHTHAWQYGCKHYKRKALLVAACCNKPFPCRCVLMLVLGCRCLGYACST
jgi:zinc finger-like protein